LRTVLPRFPETAHGEHKALIDKERRYVELGGVPSASKRISKKKGRVS